MVVAYTIDRFRTYAAGNVTAFLVRPLVTRRAASLVTAAIVQSSPSRTQEEAGQPAAVAAGDSHIPCARWLPSATST
jgi:hypothetical protein